MIHIDGTWEPGKYLYIKDRTRPSQWIRFGEDVGFNGEIGLHFECRRSTIPPATITEVEVHGLYQGVGYREIYTFSWITRDEAQALLDMAIARNTLETP